MIRKLRLKLGSSADKRCVWLHQCAATSDKKAEGFGTFLVCEAKYEKMKGVTGLWFLIQVSQTRAGTGRLSQSYRRRSKSSPVAFPAVWQRHGIHWRWASAAAAVAFSFFLVTKERSHRLWVYVRWCPVLWAVKVADVWSFLSDVASIFKPQQSLIDCCSSVKGNYTCWSVEVHDHEAASLVYSLDPEVLWCVHFTDLLSLGSGSSFLWCFLLKMYRLLISQGFMETFSPTSNLSFFFCFLCRPPKWTSSTHSVQAVGGRSFRLSALSVSPTSRASRVHSSIKDCVWFNSIFKRHCK